MDNFLIDNASELRQAAIRTTALKLKNYPLAHYQLSIKFAYDFFFFSFRKRCK